MSSSWGKKLEKKLNDLADTASKESIQTLSNWIAFNRKHVHTITTVLTKALQEFKGNDKRQWLYWQIIHEILLREKGNASKWEKLGELRLALGETLQPTMKSLGSSMPDQLETYLEEWEDQDVFGGPSLNAQIRLIYQNRKNVTTTGQTANVNASTTPPEATDNTNTNCSAPVSQEPPTNSITADQSTLETPKSPNKSADLSSTGFEKSSGDKKELSTDDDGIISGPKDDDGGVDPGTGQKEQQKSESTDEAIPSTEKSETPPKRNQPLKEQAKYDFQSKGVPSGAVESRDFRDPCTAISTLQIARDIRTNTAVEASTALEKLPADILSACEDLASGKLSELDSATTNDFSIRIPSNLIDLDIEEEASNLNMFQDIVERQQKAREKLIYLMLRSRCKFGSKEAAQEFYEIDGLTQKLKNRKELLSDALELEGVDTAEIGNDSKKRKPPKELPPLTWYDPDSKDGSASVEGQTIESNKKQKVV